MTGPLTFTIAACLVLASVDVGACVANGGRMPG
jgi:hypothetical protein